MLTLGLLYPGCRLNRKNQMTIANYDATPGLKGVARCLDRIQKQQAWIDACEANGRSYTGENGEAIRQADRDELHFWEAELRRLQGFDLILETVVYDGSQKVWRILNLNTGTVYSSEFAEQVKAIDAIEHGKIRGGRKVQYVSLQLIVDTVKPIL